MRAAGYLRVSHKEQVEGYSLEAQADSIRSFCAGRGWTLVHIYTDAGHSAPRESYRPAFEQMMQDARARRFGVLVVDKKVLQRCFYTGVLLYYGTDDQGRKRKRGQFVEVFLGNTNSSSPPAASTGGVRPAAGESRRNRGPTAGGHPRPARRDDREARVWARLSPGQDYEDVL